MSDILILTDLEPYQDRWHAQSATSATIRALLQRWGHRVRVAPDLDESDLSSAELLVVNSAGRGSEEDPALQRRDELFGAWRGAGLPLLALHGSAIAFRGSRRWRELLGGAWNPGISRHPQIGNCLIHVHRDSAPARGLNDFIVYDERYSNLDLDPSSNVLASHVEDGVRHALAWSRVDESGSRVVYDGLGHGVESYDSPGRVALLAAEVAWLLEGSRGALTRPSHNA
jgi:type 1 glutamine amidotransferase